MNFKRTIASFAAGLGLCGLAAAPAVLSQEPPAPGIQAPDQDDPAQPGVEILASGPVHEAFAERVVYDPELGPIIAKQPPENIEELPPDQKPEGDNVAWVPGYWAWDDGRDDFLWVSGIWRVPPPGRQWMPGYWSQVQGGWQWVSGTWMPIEAASAPEAEVQYLSQPPATLEVGPNVPAPAADQIWVPGSWVWQQRYVWRPGFWMPAVTDWVWIPAHYVATPGGWLFVPGYWDYMITQRGMLFAPVYYSQPVYSQPSYVYTPPVVVNPLLMLQSLFIQPNGGSYFFGDYYGGAYAQRGYVPWYSNQQRRGYDPMFNYLSATTFRNNPRWVDNVDRLYAYRRENAQARPPRTFADVRRITRERHVNVTNVENIRNIENVLNVENVRNVDNVSNAALVQPLRRVVADKSALPLRLEHVDRKRQQEIAQHSRAVREFRQQRAQFEKRAADEPERQQKRAAELPRSPIVARENAKQRPPERPRVPGIDNNARPTERRAQVTKRDDPQQPRNSDRREAMRPASPNNNARPSESPKSSQNTKNDQQRKATEEAQPKRKAQAETQQKRKTEVETQQKPKAEAETQQKRKTEAETQQKRKATAEDQQRRKATEDAQARRKAMGDIQRRREAESRKADPQRAAGSPNAGNSNNRPNAQGGNRGNDNRPSAGRENRNRREKSDRDGQPPDNNTAKDKGPEKRKD